MQKNIAYLAILALLCGCSKKDNTPAGIIIDGGVSGPSNTWLSTIAVPLQAGDSTLTTIHFNGDHSIARIVQVQFVPNGGYFAEDTDYLSTAIPVYASGRLVSIESTSDTTAASGDVTTAFDYTSSGGLERIRYNPGTSAYAYDSVTAGPGGLLGASYHFEMNSQGTALTEVYYTNYTWDNKKNLQSVLINNIGANGSITSETVTYTYDGFYNPYKTVKDLPFMFGQLNNIIPLLSANNPLSSTLVGYSSANNYTYQYNPDNLPASRNLQIVQQGSVKQSTFVNFEYTH